MFSAFCFAVRFLMREKVCLLLLCWTLPLQLLRLFAYISCAFLHFIYWLSALLSVCVCVCVLRFCILKYVLYVSIFVHIYLILKCAFEFEKIQQLFAMYICMYVLCTMYSSCTRIRTHRRLYVCTYILRYMRKVCISCH